MEQFQDRLTRLSELTEEELSELESEVVAAFDEADTAADLENMQALADALDEIRNEIASRGAGEDADDEEEAAVAAGWGRESGSNEADQPATKPATKKAEDDKSSAAAKSDDKSDDKSGDKDGKDGKSIKASADEDPAETNEDGAAEGDAADEDQPEDDGAAESDPSESEAPVATEITAEDVPEENAPVQASAPTISIRAGGDIPGITAGAQLANMDDVVDALTRKVGAMRGVSGDGEHIIVASMRTDGDVPEERMLRPGDIDGNSRKIRSLIADKDALRPDALMAAAWCAPRSPIYEIPTLGTTNRPVASSLPTFNADRGGVTWMQPPMFPDLAGAVGIWRYDEEDGWGSFGNPVGSGAAGATKPCLTIACGDEQSADVEALTLCLCFSNMTARAFPEWIRANTDLTMVAQARFAEQVLLSKMFGYAASGDCGTPATSVGVARDFLYTVRTSAAFKRHQLRLDVDAPMQLLSPSWLGDAIAIDLGLQAPGDNTYSTSRNEVDGYLHEANIDPIWYIDDAPGAAAFSDCAFPATANWLLFPTGSFVRLDAGELNLGVVRSKEDVQKNTYCEFSETFETVAYMGPADGAWLTHGVTPVNTFGATGAPIDLTA